MSAIGSIILIILQIGTVPGQAIPPTVMGTRPAIPDCGPRPQPTKTFLRSHVRSLRYKPPGQANWCLPLLASVAGTVELLLIFVVRTSAASRSPPSPLSTPQLPCRRTSAKLSIAVLGCWAPIEPCSPRGGRQPPPHRTIPNKRVLGRAWQCVFRPVGGICGPVPTRARS